MRTNSSHSECWKIAACVALVLLLLQTIGALVFWQERMLFYDAPFVAFRLINLGELQIAEHRYGSFITQMVPLAGSWLQLPLKLILIGYNLSFPVFYLLVGLLLIRWRAYPFVILLALYLSLFVSNAYFWTNNEVHQGTAWLMLWMGFLWRAQEQEYNPWIVLCGSLPLMFLAVFTHPLLIFSTVFLWVFLLVDKRFRKFPTWLLLSLSTVLFLLVFIKQQMSRGGWYDASKIEQITKANAGEMLQAFGNEMSLTFLKQMAVNYWLFPLLLLFGLFTLLQQRRRWQLLWTLGSLTAFYLMLCLSFPDWVTFHAESEWMTFSLIGVTPFVFYGLPCYTAMRAAGLLALIFVVRLLYMAADAPKFVKRQELRHQMVAQMRAKGLTKVALLDARQELSFDGLPPWALPVESMYASVFQGDTVQRTVIVIDSGKAAQVENLPVAQLAAPWELYWPEKWNSYYFHPDTVHRYQVMTLEELMR